MSKIEIDTSKVSLEEQIEAALTQASRKGLGPYGANCGGSYENAMRLAICDFAAGNFSKAPEIKKPNWAVNTGCLPCGAPLRGFMAFADGAELEARAWGPVKPTEREAILAFNELFGGAE